MVLESIREKVTRAAQTRIGADETVRAVIWGVSSRPYLIALTGASYRAIVCTDQRTLLYEGDPLVADIGDLLQAIDGQVRLGPPRGVFYHRVKQFRTPVYVSRRFFKDIRRADA